MAEDAVAEGHPEIGFTDDAERRAGCIADDQMADAVFFNELACAQQVKFRRGCNQRLRHQGADRGVVSLAGVQRVHDVSFSDDAERCGIGADEQAGNSLLSHQLGNVV